MGIGINNIINTFNPQQIIIGNRLAMTKELLLHPIMEVIESHSLRHNQTNLNINFAELANYLTALGISASVTEFFLKSDLHKKI
ncbi:putative NBD/HSP70 family sugar kinase [Bacillus fengqiuensis]|nr:putative NBD/HSP70 family sugar kinase [Bacillus fengqiuensis]